MLGPTHVLNPPQEEVAIPQPLKKLEQTKKTTSLSRFMKYVSKKRPLSLFRTSTFHSQSSTCTAATDMTERTDVSDAERTVRFSAKPAVHFVLSRDDYSTEELRASWFQHEEYAKITRKCCKQVRKMEDGEILKDRKYCSRGLEAHTRLFSITKSANRKLAFSAVLDEQEEQRQLEVVDDEEIRQLYNQVSSSCQLWATTLGFRDQREAERYID
jgi:hypothetical protein